MKKSIRKELYREIPNYKNWRVENWFRGETGSAIKGFQIFESAFADFDENGKCIEITCYSYGSGKQEKHYYGWDGCIDITDVIMNWDDYVRSYGYKKARDLIIDDIKEKALKEM